jgi:hypothetical protein
LKISAFKRDGMLKILIRKLKKGTYFKKHINILCKLYICYYFVQFDGMLVA